MDQVTEVVVSGLALDAKSNSPVVILKEKDGERMLPIWIGVFEANAIAMELAEVSLKRPLTYDLISSILMGLEAQVDRVIISDLQDSTYFAKLRIRHAGGLLEIDARPSDSIALALKTQAAIVVAEHVLSPGSDGAPAYDPAGLRERLQNIDPESFGDFKL